MFHFAIGPVSTQVLTCQQVVTVFVETDAPAAPSGQQRINITTFVTTGVDPQSFVGRRFNVPPGGAISLRSAPSFHFEGFRDDLKARYRALEGVAGLAAWRLFGGDVRTSAYLRWVYNQAAVSSINANLSSLANRTLLTREANFNGSFWYHVFFLARSGGRGTGGVGTEWDDNLGIGASSVNTTIGWVPNVFYVTAESSATTANSLGWRSPGSVEAGASFTLSPTAVGSAWDPIAYLHG